MIYHCFGHLIVCVDHNMVIVPVVAPNLGCHDNCIVSGVDMMDSQVWHIVGPVHLKPSTVAESSDSFGIAIYVHTEMVTGPSSNASSGGQTASHLSSTCQLVTSMTKLMKKWIWNGLTPTGPHGQPNRVYQPMIPTDFEMLTCVSCRCGVGWATLEVFLLEREQPCHNITSMLVTFGICFRHFDSRYLVFYNTSPPRMFLSQDLLWEYRIQHGANGPLYVTSSYSTSIFCRGVSGFATDCPCRVWCRGLTTCLLHVGPPFGNRILNNIWAVGLT